MSQLADQLFHEIFMARQRVNAVRSSTPLQLLTLPEGHLHPSTRLFAKREDLPPIYAYKWRGAYNRMATLSQHERDRGVAAASAGNHAQGVALAAKLLNIHAHIFMPRSTPRMKQQAVAKHGQNHDTHNGNSHVTITLVGDTVADAMTAARAAAKEHNLAFVHPYDDLMTMAGQGTLADEIIMSSHLLACGNPARTAMGGGLDVAYLQIGGGGMAASVACWLKRHNPHIKIIGVEGEHQASMKAAIENDAPTTLDHVDIFCDGTAVSRAGDLTFPLCKEFIDEFITVTNAQVGNAIRLFWVAQRRILEPSGAMGLAGLLSHAHRFEQTQNQQALVITCGANMDFSQLARIAAGTGVGGSARKHLRLHLKERPGTLLHALNEIDAIGAIGANNDATASLNIVDFQFGKTHPDHSFPIIGIDDRDGALDILQQALTAIHIQHDDVSDHADVDYRIIPYNPELFHDPLFIQLEFPERPGALRDFLALTQNTANLCYFNYSYSGESVGRAIIGFEFQSPPQRKALEQILKNDHAQHGYIRPLPPDVVTRILK